MNTDTTSHIWKPSNRGTFTALVLALTLAAATSAKADNTWDGGGADDNWLTPANWGADAIPTLPGLLTFDGAVRLTPNNDNVGAQVDGFTFAATAGAFTIGGNAITLGGNIVNTASANAQIINLDMTLGADRTVSAATNVTLGGVISGAGGLTKDNTGVLILSGANTYDGVTTISAVAGSGVISVSNASGLGSSLGGTVVGATNTLELNNVSIASESLALNSASISVTALRHLTGTHSYGGPITVGGVNGNCRIKADAGQLTLTAPLAVTVAGNLTFSGAGDIVVSSVISGVAAVNLVRDGTGTLTLNGVNTFPGAVTVQGGTLKLGSANAIFTATAGLTVRTAVTAPAGDPAYGNGVFDLNGFSESVGAIVLGLSSSTLASTAGQTPSIINSGGGSPILTYSSVQYLAGSVGFLNGQATISANLFGNGNRTFTIGDGAAAVDTVVSGVISSAVGGSLTKSGLGTMSLSGLNTYTGPTAVNGGKLLVNGSLAAASAVTVAAVATLGGNGTINGTVVVSGSIAPGESIGRLTMTNTLTLNASGIALMEIDKANGTNDSVTGLSSITYGGTLTVTNLGGTLATGDTYQLFSATSYVGNFTATNLPALNPGLQWIWTPASGTLAVAASYSTTPTNITSSVSGGILSLTWPGSHLGWLAQSNSVNVADTNFWFNIAGSDLVTNLNITINPATPKVFYRLSLP